VTAPVGAVPQSLRQAFVLAFKYQDAVWYRQMLRKDICGGPLSREESQAVVSGAVAVAAELAGNTAARYPGLTHSQLAGALDLRLAASDEEPTAAYARMGYYQPDSRIIVLNETALSLVRQFISANGLDDLTPPEDVARVAVFHEIFHALEEANPDIYTRSSMLRRRQFGLFTRSLGLRTASEVGAVHFSKCLAGISYSPCLFESYLLMALGQLSIDLLLPKM
jgi:hypothetical protein